MLFRSRTFVLWVIVENTALHSVFVQAALIAVGFSLRYLYQSRIVYKKMSPEPTLDDIIEAEEARADEPAIPVKATEPV